MELELLGWQIVKDDRFDDMGLTHVSIRARHGARAALSSAQWTTNPFSTASSDSSRRSIRLWRASEAGGLTDNEHKRLHSVRKELDECWSALRLRRAGEQPLADSEVPDPPNDLDGPEPEPPHLEHGVHDDEPAPDPGINPNVP